jgi:hypothetical protein
VRQDNATPGQSQVSPEQHILGVVAPSGAGGGLAQGENLWTLTFALEAWRAEGSELRASPLHLSQPVSEQELKRLMGLIIPHLVIRVRARLAADSVSGYQRAVLVSFEGACESDVELNRVAEELQRPVTHADHQFGTLTLDRRLDEFCAESVWDERSVMLSLAESEDLHDNLDTARALWADQTMWSERIMDFATAKLLSLKNRSWLSEDEQEHTPEEFKRKLSLQSISVYPEGRFEFWYDDGDMFGGHSIAVSGTLDVGLTDAGIHG